MARKEKPVDPGTGPLAEFAADLRRLRAQAGNIPYRTLAKRAGYSASTLSVAASGTMLPSLEVTLAYVQVCGGDPDAWRARWHQVAAQLSRLVNDAVPVGAGEAAGLSVDRGRLGVMSAPPGPDPRGRRGTRWLASTTAAALALLFLAAVTVWFASATRSKPIASHSLAPSTIPAPGIPLPPTVYYTPYSPAADGSCGAIKPRAASAMPVSLAGDVQRLPSQFSPGAPAGGPLVVSAETGFGTWYNTQAVQSIGDSLMDVTGTGYDDPSLTDTGGTPFMYITVGTPKPDQCWELLAYDALAHYAGTEIMDIHTETPGPHLATGHVVLECGEVEAYVVNMCAWAGPGPAGGKPVFGVIDVVPDLRVMSQLSSPNIAAFADRIYAALTAA